MTIVRFPAGDGGPTLLGELEDALTGRTTGPVAESWRELRSDVRALAPPIDPAFERALRERLATRTTRSARDDDGTRRRPRALRAAASRSWWRPALALLLCAALLVPISIVAFTGTGRRAPSAHVPAVAESSRPAARTPAVPGEAGGASSATTVVPGRAVPLPATSDFQATGSATPGAGRRLQQLAASMTLTSTPADLQTLADRVSALAIGEGGFVERSQVQQQSTGGEAQLTLRLPSSKLSTALAALGRLAPVASQSRSLQDITSSYDAARGRLADAKAEREALLRALARAQTQAALESLHARLLQARTEIGRAIGQLAAISRRTATAEVEVSVIASQHSSGGGLSVPGALRDAGRVLLATLLVLAIAAAVLVPLALVALVLAGARRAWLRLRRERALTDR